MRIRQVRPEFFTDAVVSRLPAAIRLTYIGLWCVADDAGWMTWDVPQIAAQLSPYESVRAREKHIQRAGDVLQDKGRLVFYECGCAHVPKLEEHQRIGGNKSFTARDEHLVHTRTDKSVRRIGAKQGESAPQDIETAKVQTSMDKSSRNVRLGNVTVNARASANDDDEDRPALLAAYRRQGMPVDVQ